MTGHRKVNLFKVFAIAAFAQKQLHNNTSFVFAAAHASLCFAFAHFSRQ